MGENSSDLAKRSFLSIPGHFSCVLLVSSSLWVDPSVCLSIGGTCWWAASSPWSACGFKVLPLIGFVLTYGQSGFLPPSDGAKVRSLNMHAGTSPPWGGRATAPSPSGPGTKTLPGPHCPPAHAAIEDTGAA